MKDLNEFIEFLINHRDDNRIQIYRKMKYGFKHFYIDFFTDKEKNGSTFLRPSLSLIIDNRNKCIDISSTDEDQSIIIEDDYLIDYWSSKLDEILSKDLDDKIKSIIETTLISCDNKNLHREYLMKKIIKDESL